MSGYSPTSLPRNPDWRDDAECRRPDYDPELWHPAGSTGAWIEVIADAKRVCFGCPVMEKCRQWALARPEESGIWGGTTDHERANWRRRMARKANQGPARTVADVYAASTKATTGGHVIWTGHPNTSIGGVSYSPNRLAWAATQAGEPVGAVTRYCGVKGCVAHLNDQPGRIARLGLKQPDPNDPSTRPECGTRHGYQMHLRRGEPTCKYCRAAHAAASRGATAAA